ncbi:MAG: phosphocholine cytidylyltransferase family protein [Muribaculaceae bacterium]|nr:phosphocholine cytidylyltransferase family protein [Muribaculaceae bacterium]
MIGVILAAGMARRLRPLTDKCPKCLLKVGKRSLLHRTVDAMIAAGVDRLIVVTGYKGQMIVDELESLFPLLEKVFVNNADYENNNNIFSLWMTRPYVDGKQFLLADSDILLDPVLIKRVVDEGPSSIALNRHELGDEEMKIVVDDAMNVIRITKQCNPAEAIGESVGIEYISAAYSSALFAELEQMIEREGLKDKFYELAFERLIPQGHRFRAVDTTELFSMELDTPQDFEQATSIVPPHIL